MVYKHKYMPDEERVAAGEPKCPKCEKVGTLEKQEVRDPVTYLVTEEIQCRNCFIRVYDRRKFPRSKT